MKSRAKSPKAHGGWELQVTQRSDQEKGFKVVAKRWVVERTFGWFMKHAAW